MRRIEGLAEKATSEGVRLEANRILLDRGWGKPAQTHAHTGEDGVGPIVVEVVHRERKR